MSKTSFNLDEATLGLLNTLENSGDEDERLAAIQDLSRSSIDGFRVLLEIYPLLMWRSTKVSILRTLGQSQDSRVIDFLIDVGTNSGDFGLALEAILALGRTDTIIAAEFLLSIIEMQDHPLCREAVVGLTNSSLCFYADSLANLLSKLGSSLSESLVQHIILGLGRCGDTKHLDKIQPFLTTDTKKSSGLLFNAALIAAGSLGNLATKRSLEAMETSHRFFANQLRQLAIQKIQLRLSQSIEDIVENIILSDEVSAESLSLLRTFNREEAYATYKVLSDQVDCNKELLIRLNLFSPQNQEEDLDFIKSNIGEARLQPAAALISAHLRCGEGIDVLKYLAQFDLDLSIRLMGFVKSNHIIEYLEKTIGDEGESSQTRKLAINSLVQQVWMCGSKPELVEKEGAFLVSLIKNSHDSGVYERAVRALGQIKYTEKSAIMLIGNHLKEKKEHQASLYWTLSRLPSSESSRIIAKRVKVIKASPESEGELRVALGNLCRHSIMDGLDQLVPLTDEALEKNKISLLKILSHNTLDGFESIIESGLRSENFQEKMLAIAASRANSNETIRAILIALIDDENPCYRGRALDSICYSGSLKDHRILLDRCLDEQIPKDVILKILRSLSPQEGVSYSSIVARIDALMVKVRTFQDSDVADAATNLRDNLLLIKENSSQKDSHKPSGVINTDSIDEGLSSKIDAFASYSENVKTVLRNGELTFSHRDIFHERVDKSTIVVEFVKSIDLLLQDKLGSKLFLKVDGELITKMQSRIIQLQLNDPNIKNSVRVKELDCQGFFSESLFPGHKLVTLCTAILSGKFVRDKYRCVDGLRAWAVLLLIYGRRFHYKNNQIEPLFKLKKSTNASISEIAGHLNLLQDLRNRAAHLGVLIDEDQIAEIRKKIFMVLNQLSEVL